ncbi:MAG: M20 family metallopeptidase [Candidatus Freyarchaeota archaeon]
MSENEAFSLVENFADEAVDVLKDLIKIKTVVPPGNNYEEIVKYLEPQFSRIGFETERVTVPEEMVKRIPAPLEGPRVNLVAKKVFGEDKPYITFYAHTDVVPVEEKWSVPPFEGVVKEGRIYGRGASDMKGFIATVLLALKVINELDLKPNYNITCVMCTDEEIGVYPGVYYLVDQGYVKGDVICGEAVHQIIGIGTAGSIVFDVTVKGRSAHTMAFWTAINAVENTVPVLEELLKLKEKVMGRRSEVPGLPTPYGDKMMPLFSINMIKGGAKENIIPGECRFSIDRRYIPEEKEEEVVAEFMETIEAAKKKSKVLAIETNVVRAYKPLKVSPQKPIVKKLAAAVKHVTGLDVGYLGAAGATDMGYVAEKGHDVAIMGVGDLLSNFHGADESINIGDMVKYAKELVHLLCFQKFKPPKGK